MFRIITLFFALSLILAVSYPVVNAHSDTPLSRRHAPALNRMMKKRASFLDINNAAGAGSAQQDPNNAVVQQPSVASSTPTDPAKTTNAQPTDNNQPSVTQKTSATPVAVLTQVSSPVSLELSGGTTVIYSYTGCSSKLCLSFSIGSLHREHHLGGWIGFEHLRL